MEKENDKSREDSRKQYNSTVARLVAFCKKLDPRYASVVEAEKLERERKEEEAKRRQEEIKQKREEELRRTMVTGVTQVGFEMNEIEMIMK